MASSGLRGPFALTSDGINAIVPQRPGAYALGKYHGSTFYISRVGRSDNDTNDRLHDYVGLARYPHFKFEVYSSAGAAFLKECELFHTFSPPDNDIHPDSPNGVNLTCPFCR
jgi:hypothetical protein